MGDVDEFRCFVGSLSWSTTDRGLKDAFEKFGRLIEAKVNYLVFLHGGTCHIRRLINVFDPCFRCLRVVEIIKFPGWGEPWFFMFFVICLAYIDVV